MNTKNVLSVGLIMLLIISGTSAWAQGRGRSNGHGNGHDKSHDNGRGNSRHNDDRNRHDKHTSHHAYHDNDRHDRHYNDRHYNGHHHGSRRVVHVYHPAPVERRVVHHYHYERPRYVYYRDYDVYYDCHRQVYISFSGRNWSISAGLPVVMRHVNVQTVVTTNVEYYDDDFPEYLETRRPGGRLYAEW